MIKVIGGKGTPFHDDISGLPVTFRVVTEGDDFFGNPLQRLLRVGVLGVGDNGPGGHLSKPMEGVDDVF